MNGLTEDEIRKKYAPYGDMIINNMNGQTVMKDENGDILFFDYDVENAFRILKRINKIEAMDNE